VVNRGECNSSLQDNAESYRYLDFMDKSMVCQYQYGYVLHYTLYPIYSTSWNYQNKGRVHAVTFDDRLTWKQHINKAATKTKSKLAILRQLSGATWGVTGKILCKVYQQAIRPHLEHGSAVWCPASNNMLQELEKIQNQALRESTGRTQALSERRDTKVLIQTKKFICMPNHPMKERFRNLTMGRLERSSFFHKAKCLLKQNPELPDIVSPLKSIPEQTPWKDKSEKSANTSKKIA
jgi:hypothetical protein